MNKVCYRYSIFIFSAVHCFLQQPSFDFFPDVLWSGNDPPAAIPGFRPGGRGAGSFFGSLLAEETQEYIIIF